jgi:hypothetical protein
LRGVDDDISIRQDAVWPYAIRDGMPDAIAVAADMVAVHTIGNWLICIESLDNGVSISPAIAETVHRYSAQLALGPFFQACGNLWQIVSLRHE